MSILNADRTIMRILATSEAGMTGAELESHGFSRSAMYSRLARLIDLDLVASTATHREGMPLLRSFHLTQQGREALEARQ